jgi:hypothetical protein
MKALLLIIVAALTGCASRDHYAATPFTFVGVAEALSTQTHQNVHGEERSLIVRVLEVKKGSFEAPHVAFGVPAHSPSPLEVGKTYRIEAAWGRHGMLLLDAKPLEGLTRR